MALTVVLICVSLTISDAEHLFLCILAILHLLWKNVCRVICVLVIQLCPTLCDPMDGSPLGSSVHEILQARILEWVAILFSRRSAWTRGLYPGLLHGRQILYHLSHQGSPCPVICPLSNQVICFCCWVITLYIFWILIPYQIYDLWILSPAP